jgi:hypothetical protein
VIYNTTEAAFKVMNPIWIVFLLAVTAVPEAQEQEEPASQSDDEREDSGALDWGYRHVSADPVHDTTLPQLQPTSSAID